MAGGVLARHRRLDFAAQVVRHGDLERAAAGHKLAVLQRVVHGAQAVAHGVLELRDRVVVLALQQDCARLGVARVLDERELLLAQAVLVHLARVAEALLTLHGGASAVE